MPTRSRLLLRTHLLGGAVPFTFVKETSIINSHRYLSYKKHNSYPLKFFILTVSQIHSCSQREGKELLETPTRQKLIYGRKLQGVVISLYREHKMTVKFTDTFELRKKKLKILYLKRKPSFNKQVIPVNHTHRQYALVYWSPKNQG